jgi:hypothetical protein
MSLAKALTSSMLLVSAYFIFCIKLLVARNTYV